MQRILVDHGRMKPAFGYIFSKDNINVGFTVYTSLCKSVEILSEKCSYLFCDCMLIRGNGKHQGIGNLEYLQWKRVKIVKVIKLDKV